MWKHSRIKHMNNTYLEFEGSDNKSNTQKYDRFVCASTVWYQLKFAIAVCMYLCDPNQWIDLTQLKS